MKATHTDKSAGDQAITAHYAQLLDVLTQLEKRIARQNSLRYAFLRGAIYGLGTVIGATVLLALLTGFITATFGSIAELPLLGPLLEQDTTTELPSAP